MLPRLHVVTDDEVLARPRFLEDARSILETHGAALALHVRGHATPVRRLHDLVRALAPAAAAAGGLLLVNDRADLALAEGVGVQLGRRSLAVSVVRGLVGPDRAIGYSAHDARAAVGAVADGADFVLLGAIWATRSHPGRPGAGAALVRRATERMDAPVVAIGGVTPERVADALAAGAYGVAVLGGVWGVAGPVAAADRYLERLEVRTG